MASSSSPDELIGLYIEERPFGVSDARLKDHGVPVWALIGHWEAVSKNVARAASDYDIPEPALEAAIAFYKRHKREIDARIAANAA